MMRRTWIIPASLLVAVAARAGDVTIDASKDVYALGEVVSWTITNGTDEIIESNSIPPGTVVQVDTGNGVWNCLSIPGVHEIPPGVRETYMWGQIDCSTGLPAPPGMYVALFSYWFASGGDGATIAAAFCIDSNCGPTPLPAGTPQIESASWSGIKAIYR